MPPRRPATIPPTMPVCSRCDLTYHETEDHSCSAPIRKPMAGVLMWALVAVAVWTVTFVVTVGQTGEPADAVMNSSLNPLFWGALVVAAVQSRQRSGSR